MGIKFLQSIGLTNQTVLDLASYTGKRPEFQSTTFCDCGYHQISEVRNNLESNCPSCKKALFWKTYTKGQAKAKFKMFRKKIAGDYALRVLKNNKLEEIKNPYRRGNYENVSIKKIQPLFPKLIITGVRYCLSRHLVEIDTACGKTRFMKAPIKVGYAEIDRLSIEQQEVELDLVEE